MGDRAALAIGGGAAALLAAAFFAYTVDDAYISLRYAEHLRQGLGLVWNPGEVPRVEGYSNFAWVLAMAAAGALTPDFVETAIKALGVACGLLCLPAVLAVARRFHAGAWGRATPVLLVGAAPTFWFWAGAGLETAAFTLCVLGAMAFAATGHARYAGLFVLAALLRPEGAYLFVLVWTWRLVCTTREDGVPPALAAAVREGALFSALYLPFLGWRWLYYGSLVPNTVYAKFAPWAGLDYYVLDVLLYHPLSWLAALVAPLLPGLHRRDRLARCVLLLVPAVLVLSLVNARPTMGFYFRLSWPVLPLLFVATGLCLDTVAQRWGRGAAGALLGILLVNPLIGLPTALDTAAGQRAILEEVHRPLALQLQRDHPPDTLLAISDCGLVPYLSKLHILDLWGLNDVALARDGFSTDAVLERSPDLVAFVSRSREDVETVFPWETELLADPRFEARYAQVDRFDARERPYHLVLFARREP